MKTIFTSLTFLFFLSGFAQIKGIVTDDKGTPLPSVSVFIENTYNGTSSNEKGQYELSIKSSGNFTIVYQYLGYKTKRIPLNTSQLPVTQNITLSEENLSLTEVIINTKENPANLIIRSAIANKKDNAEKTARFKADFYSRGMIKLKDTPKKLFGQKIGDLGGALDSTGTGIVYLSETVSKITFEKPNNLKERIIASKISGDNKGFSYNTALSTAYDFYDNTVDFSIKMISPIADNAFNYYRYKLEGTFNTDNNQMINKIKIIAKRDAEPVFEGYIYIVEDSWAIYAVDLDIKGYRMHEEFMDIMNLKQNFSYNKQAGIWAKNTQNLEFTAGAFGIKLNGKFSYVYSNYEFQDTFAKKTFTNEIVSFEENSNKKDTIFWNRFRPIPLTEEEENDYLRKDSIYKVRNSKTYLDSVDRKNNKFKLLNPITGYNYKNSSKKYSINYTGLIDIGSISFNTVQGYTIDSGVTFRTWKNEEKGKYTTIGLNANYGFAEERARFTGNFSHRFNNQDYATITISGGTKAAQFNPDEPISKFINTISTLFFKNNFMKLYNKEFVSISYQQEVANGITMSGKLEYQQRKPLFNNTDYTFIKSDDLYTSNNPLVPDNDLLPAFQQHHLTKGTFSTRINFGNKYITRPDGKLNLRNSKFPTLFLSYESAFAGSEKNYEYQLATARVSYILAAGNKGNFTVDSRIGKFFNADGIAFIDYKHFTGNQTRIGQGFRVFNLLPYYSNSTNDAYDESHFQYNDNGFIMNKIPLLNLLRTNLILTYHNLAVPDRKPYSEVGIGLNNLGFGKFRILRLDYVRSYQSGFKTDGIIFSIKFLNLLE